MDQDRIHRAISDDGTEIAGRVHGTGPPLVLVHGSLEDGDLVWAPLLPFLRERFTCYLMSTRGRGLSGEHPDVSLERLVQDVTAFVESIGAPVGLVGESYGGTLVLGAAARSSAVSAVAVHEPVVFEVLGERDAARFQETVGRVGALAAEGRPADAARTFAEPLLNDDELAALSSSGYFEDAGRYVPALLREIEQSGASDGPGPTDPSALGRIGAPLLVLLGARTALRPWFPDGARHVAQHVAGARFHELDGSGHWGPFLHPEPIANELVRFFQSASRAA